MSTWTFLGAAIAGAAAVTLASKLASAGTVQTTRAKPSAPLPSITPIVPSPALMGGPYLEGIDTSSYQETFDPNNPSKIYKRNSWPTIAASGVSFAIMKSSEATGADPMFRHNWEESQGNVVRGAYHYGHLTMDPVAQARAFAAIVGPLSAGDLPPSLDLEWQYNEGVRDPVVFGNWLRAFVKEAQQLFARRIMIYTSIGYWGYVGNPKLHDVADACPLWVAHHTRRAQPLVPSIWSHWSVWQYYGGEAPGPDIPQKRLIPGIGLQAAVDLNRFSGGTRESLQKFIDETKKAA